MRYKTNFPSCRIIISALYPRTNDDTLLISNNKVTAFNNTAQRHQKRLRSLSESIGYDFFPNESTWRTFSKALEDPTQYRPAGAHLNRSGKRAVLTGWLKIIDKIVSTM
jgi:hypothetical protein